MNSLGEGSAEWRQAYADAAAWFVSIAERATPRPDEHGLGVWTVRDLLGHTGRAMSTLAEYLGTTEPVETLSAADYYRLVMQAVAPESVAERGRAAGQALGAELASSLAQVRRETMATLDGACDDAGVASPVGVMSLAEYLPTRTFELTVHSCDLARALDLPLEVPPSALRSSLALAGRLAGPRAGEILLSLTGRVDLPSGFTVLAPPAP